MERLTQVRRGARKDVFAVKWKGKDSKQSGILDAVTMLSFSYYKFKSSR
jgi:hypothetical protein